MNTSKLTYRNALRLTLAFVMALAIPVSMRADDGDGNAEQWTAVGSTGAVDEGSLGRIGFYQSVAFLNGHGTGIIRYNVTATDDLFGGGTTRLTLRYLDGGACTRVQAFLIRYNFASGANDTLMTFNSDSFPNANFFQVRSIDQAGLPAFDFNNNAYFVEVHLSDGCGSAGARIGLLKLQRL